MTKKITDPNQIAKLVVDKATEQPEGKKKEDELPKAKKKGKGTKK